MLLSHELVDYYSSLFFERAVLLLVDGESYVEHHHLLTLIEPADQIAFLELLRPGTPLRACFAELDRFLAWQEECIPLLRQEGIVVDSVAQQVTLYRLDKRLKPVWLALGQSQVTTAVPEPDEVAGPDHGPASGAS